MARPRTCQRPNVRSNPVSPTSHEDCQGDDSASMDRIGSKWMTTTYYMVSALVEVIIPSCWPDAGGLRCLNGSALLGAPARPGQFVGFRGNRPLWSLTYPGLPSGDSRCLSAGHGLMVLPRRSCLRAAPYQLCLDIQISAYPRCGASI